MLSLEIYPGDLTDSDWESDYALRDVAGYADGIAEKMAEEIRDYEAGRQDGATARTGITEARAIGADWLEALGTRNATRILTRSRRLRAAMGWSMAASWRHGASREHGGAAGRLDPLEPGAWRTRSR